MVLDETVLVYAELGNAPKKNVLELVRHGVTLISVHLMANFMTSRELVIMFLLEG